VVAGAVAPGVPTPHHEALVCEPRFRTDGPGGDDFPGFLSRLAGDYGHRQDQEPAIGRYFKKPYVQRQASHLSYILVSQVYLPDLLGAGSGGQEIEAAPVGRPAGIGIVRLPGRGKAGKSPLPQVGDVNGQAAPIGGEIGLLDGIGHPACVGRSLGIGDPFHGKQIGYGERVLGCGCRWREGQAEQNKQAKKRLAIAWHIFYHHRTFSGNCHFLFCNIAWPEQLNNNQAWRFN